MNSYHRMTARDFAEHIVHEDVGADREQLDAFKAFLFEDLDEQNITIDKDVALTVVQLCRIIITRWMQTALRVGPEAGEKVMHELTVFGRVASERYLELVSQVVDEDFRAIMEANFDGEPDPTDG